MTANRFAKPDNFGHPIRNPLLREHFVYRAFNAAGELLYVGCTKTLEGRRRDHQMDRRWYSKARTYTIAGPYNYETARDIERTAIRTEGPLYNETPERRAYEAARSRVVKRRYNELLALGVDWTDAVSLAVRHGDRVIGPSTGRGPFRADEAVVFRAKQADREDARRVRAA